MEELGQQKKPGEKRAVKLKWPCKIKGVRESGRFRHR